MSEHLDRFTLEAYVENALPGVQRRTVEAHLTTCPTCQARLATAKQMVALLYELPREMPALNLTARINAAVAAQRAPTVPIWIRVLILAAFVVGVVLLMLAAPQWGGLTQAIAQLPTGQTMANWLDQVVNDPAVALDTAMALAEQMLTGAAGDMGALLTLATVLLASASVAGLAELLGSERPRASSTNLSL